MNVLKKVGQDRNRNRSLKRSQSFDDLGKFLPADTRPSQVTLRDYHFRNSYIELTLVDVMTSRTLICFIPEKSEPTLTIGAVYRIKGMEVLRMGREETLLIDRLIEE